MYYTESCMYSSDACLWALRQRSLETDTQYCVVFSLSVQFDAVNDGGGLDAKPWCLNVCRCRCDSYCQLAVPSVASSGANLSTAQGSSIWTAHLRLLCC